MLKILTQLWNSKKKINRKARIPEAALSESPNLDSQLAKNLSQIKERFKDSVDVAYREFSPGFDLNKKAGLIYIYGLVNSELTNNTILKPLMFELPKNKELETMEQGNLLEKIKRCALPNSNLREAATLQDVITGILSGDTALLLDGFPTALLIETKGWETMGIKEPDTEAVVRGPREGFTETIGVNTAMLRRKIKNEKLRLESLNSLGRQTKTLVYIAYIEGIVNEKFVTEVKKRLQRIDIDGILESGYIEQLIEDAPTSIFPTIGNTEKPDILASKLLEGRVGILVDGTPFALTVPYLLIEAFQSAEDYYSRPYYSTLIRMIRYVALFISVLFPALYVSLQSFHPEMIPTSLLISMAGAREGVPFPAYIEALVMGVVFEIMREAGVRMPRPIGQSVSIVGSLVLGEAAVRAGFISNPMVIVVAITAIASFVVTPIADAMALMRLFFVLCASNLGLFGVLMGILFIDIHVMKLRSFGIPYLYPVAPMNFGELNDVFIRPPLWSRIFRSRLLSQNRVRGRSLKPSPPKNQRNEES
ncbi:MAG TPA: spore germination protein [Desulfosporosinus sp.]|nr:spore germination protein [Desulfosporosinus sp.]